MGDRKKADSSKKQQIAIVHYHLRRGGVTRVIEGAADVLTAMGHEVLLLSGEEPVPASSKRPVRVIPALNYRRTGNSVIADSLEDVLKKEAADHFGCLPDVWHFHNPTLAKNVLFPSVIRELAEEGQRVVLQLHDFAEDGRPGNYTVQRSFFDSEDSFESTLYPVAKQIHYATINRRDHDFLQAAGVSRSNLHVLPNAVSELKVRTTPEDRPFSRDKLYAIYPVRGIRRKNIGELLLLAMFHEDKVHYATSLNPENPEWEAGYGAWQDAVEEFQLPVTLGIADGEKYDYLDLVGWADFVVTTSVAEGFGLAFLEPWTVGKGVMGRDLPDITKDFAENGLELRNLYQRIEFPVEWLDEKALKGEIESMLRQSYLAYDVRLPRNAVRQTWKEWVRRKRIDFGVLNEAFQVQVLRLLHENPELRKEVSVPPLSLATEEEIRESRRIIEDVYSLERYGERLESLYSHVLEGNVGKVGHLSTDRVLDQFLKPARLNLLRN